MVKSAWRPSQFYVPDFYNRDSVLCEVQTKAEDTDNDVK